MALITPQTDKATRLAIQKLSTRIFSGLAGTNNGLLYYADGKMTSLGQATNGQLPIGSTGAAPVLAGLTGTANQITVTNGAGSATLSTPQDIHTGASPTFAGLTLTGITDTHVLYSNANVVAGNAAFTFNDSTGVVTITGVGGSGLTGYDLKIGDTTTPDYGLIQIGNAAFGRVPYNAVSMDLDGSVIIRNLGAPATSNIEFAFLESGGTSIRFALAVSATGNATLNPRSMLIAGPAVWDDEIVTVGYWQTNNSIFDNLTCDTAGAGADLGVQNDLEVEGDIFTDSIKESTTDAGVTFSDDILLANAEFFVFDKASGNGIKVDTATPTFGFADLLGDQFSKNTGGTKPTLTTYNGAIDAWQFSNGDEAFLSYHIPHDYVPGTDLHLHVHWSQNAAGATGGTVDFKYFAIYAKGHNQASGSAFTGTPITATFSSININDGSSGLTQYQQHLTEVTISAATATAALFDRDDFEPDGVIELTLEMDATNLTGTPSDPFIHYADIHYQTTGLIGTKSRTPDFYA